MKYLDDTRRVAAAVAPLTVDDWTALRAMAEGCLMGEQSRRRASHFRRVRKMVERMEEIADQVEVDRAGCPRG